MEGTTDRVFHSRGKPSGVHGGVKYEIDYRSQVHCARTQMTDRGSSNPWTPIAPLDMPSDEFLNDYIPQNLDKNVTWRNVLACGMINEQRKNKHIREDIQYDNIQIQYPEAPSPAPEPPALSPSHSSSYPTKEEKSSVVIDVSKSAFSTIVSGPY